MTNAAASNPLFHTSGGNLCHTSPHATTETHSHEHVHTHTCDRHNQPSEQHHPAQIGQLISARECQCVTMCMCECEHVCACACGQAALAMSQSRDEQVGERETEERG